MKLIEREISLPIPSGTEDIFDHLAHAVAMSDSGAGAHPIRFAVTRSKRTWECELGFLSGLDFLGERPTPSIFEFRKRQPSDHFNVALVIPTGIGAEFGGHAGDGTPVAKLFAQTCEKLILHPNVVNGSDINEMPENSLYVEGSVLARLLMGTVALQPIRSNRVVVVIDDHPDKHFVDSAINTVNAARATYGLDCAGVIKLKPSVQMWAEYAPSGRAVGVVNGMEHCLAALEKMSGDFDAVAISSVIRVPQNYHLDYFTSQGAMVNPWGGVEAMLTHAITSLLNLPAAHAPMFESRDIENLETGVVDPRMSAEAISVSFLQCVLKGLHKAPRIIDEPAHFSRSGVISADDIGCLVIPDGCLGLPTLAALEQGIKVIAVQENTNIMQNDLDTLPWKPQQFFRVRSYFEAVGVLEAIKAGIAIESLKRPLTYTCVSENGYIAGAAEEVPDRAASSKV